MIKHINKNEFQMEVLEAEGVVVVDFYADWCGPCKMLAPILEEVQAEVNHAKIVKVNVDENTELAAKYSVQSIPTIKMFVNGEVRHTSVGFQPKTALISMIEQAK
ncbi:thioredoxin [Niameybacter massiliensis]|uniref:Thioredoxin n=1 Tax=Holtiella tumoricola TaxID=3018743 RepID=A0AA42IZA2_9FIRM|nr:thioredoxin [Holtiella tumoricola]MDA3730158.1 thioredoxin [Holtiella tumoricola]